MIINNLFNETLVKPALNGGEQLFIISGYATSAMAFHHLRTLYEPKIDSKNREIDKTQ